MVKDYEDRISNDCTEEKNDNRLLKTKDVVNEYPILTQYALAKAVQDKKLTYTKVGNTNYFCVQDIENFINSGKKENSDF